MAGCVAVRCTDVKQTCHSAPHRLAAFLLPGGRAGGTRVQRTVWPGWQGLAARPPRCIPILSHYHPAATQILIVLSGSLIVLPPLPLPPPPVSPPPNQQLFRHFCAARCRPVVVKSMTGRQVNDSVSCRRNISRPEYNFASNPIKTAYCGVGACCGCEGELTGM